MLTRRAVLLSGLGAVGMAVAGLHPDRCLADAVAHGIEPGGHDEAFWTGGAPAAIRFVGHHLSPR